MHHITYKDYEGREQLIKFAAADITRVLFFVGSLSRAGMEYKHVFWD